MEKDLAGGMTADAAVIEFGGNDCNFDWQAISDDPDGEHHPNTLPHVFADTLRRMVALLRERGIRPILMTLPPIDAEKYFRFLVGDKLNAANILRWLGDKQRIYRFQEMYLAAHRARGEADAVHAHRLCARAACSTGTCSSCSATTGLHLDRGGGSASSAAQIAALVREGLSGGDMRRGRPMGVPVLLCPRRRAGPPRRDGGRRGHAAPPPRPADPQGGPLTSR